jgi:pyruvate/2-oxoglutarate dehydrogenase complex dihydrolipoamide dehydrogenase (E3) component
MNFDFTVIGGGSAGYAAARTAAGLGLRTAVIEGGAEVGGLCILRGCMPSKTLIESGNRFLTLRHAREFGLRAGDIGFDGKEIIARKRRLIGEFADYRREQLEAGKFTFLRGAATFTDPHTLAVTSLEGTETTVASRTFLIATGSAINTPPIPGLAESGCLTSDDVLDLEEIPGSVVVLGAGPVALELAHYFAALDRKVTIVQRSRQLLTGVDPDVAGVVEAAFRRRGAEVFTGTKLLRVEKDGDTRRVVFEHEGAEKTVEAAAVLNALGRKPRTARLGLDSAGVELRGHAVKTNLHQQTTAAHIFAAGDCCGPFEVVHTAIEQGELAARNAARVLQNDDALASIDYRLKLYAVFTEPQVASVGLSETEARARGLDFLTATYPFNDHGKSLVMGETEGFVKLIADKSTREIVGGSVVGPHASDLIHEIVVAMRFRATAGQLATTPHYHPTLSEIWTYPAEELAEGA